VNPYTTLLGKTGAASEAEAETQIWTEIVMKCVDSSGLVATNVCNTEMNASPYFHRSSLLLQIDGLSYSTLLLSQSNPRSLLLLRLVGL
jgi:hypothetical protein